MTRVIPFDIGCEPSPSASGEVLIASGWPTFLLFVARSKVVDETGYLKDLGIALVRRVDCQVAKLGYPNDEGLPEHPLYPSGIGDLETNVLEVIDSTWAADIQRQRCDSFQRIWGPRGTYAEVKHELRHFIITLKESTFECLASSLVVDRYFPKFEEACSYVYAELAKY
jgi:hypothetical protein